MATLRIEHDVTDYDAWKSMFDADPADRKGSGVRRYRVMRSVDAPSRVHIDLEFDDVATAQAMHTKLKGVWAAAPDGMISGVTGVVVDEVQSESL